MGFDDHEDDWRHSQEARDRNYRVIWQCSDCGQSRESYPSENEGGTCCCGGEWRSAGESYEC